MDTLPPSPWVQRWTHLLPAGSDVLDVACGGGRHLAWLADHGHRVWGVDQDLVAATALLGARAHLVCADIENAPWPLMDGPHPRRFGALVVTNYLWRPLFPLLRQSLQPGGVLIYETFADGHAAFGRPTRPEYLLRPGELLRLCEGMHVVAYENGLAPGAPRVVQRIAALLPEHSAAPVQSAQHRL